MAIIFTGITQCALCGETLKDGDDITGLPPSSNTEHPLYKYFDCGFHSHCFDNWDRKNELLEMIKGERQKFINSDYFKEMVAKYGKPKWLDETE
jgi:hypothetical protein